MRAFVANETFWWFVFAVMTDCGYNNLLKS